MRGIMESASLTDPYEDNRDADHSRQSHKSRTKKSSKESTLQKEKNTQDKIRNEDQKEDCVESRSKTRTWHSDPDRDRVSDEEGRRSNQSFYSDDYDNESPSDGSISAYSRTPSPSPPRGMKTKRTSSSSLYKTGGVGRRGVSRPQRPGGQPLIQQHRRGVRSQSKESNPPKDLDLVTKRMLSARLLKINELRNALSELQQRTDELQKENRILRQLQVRQEKALQRYDDTENEISQLLSRHNNETHVLRERLRRTQERERATERRLKDSEEQLQRSQAGILRLKKLVDQRELGARDELSRQLEEEKSRAKEAERKIKELERSIELNNNSFHRQLAAERKKTIGAQEEIRTLQEELLRLTNKLKEKERELDTKNIYANRMAKPSLRKDTDTNRKIPSRSSTKAVQTNDRISSVDFPTPPPAITDANEYNEPSPDEYLSLKELDRVNRPTEREDERQMMNNRDEDRDGQKQSVKEKVHDEKTSRLGADWDKEKEEHTRKSTGSLLNQDEENTRKRGHVQEEINKWNQDALANQQTAEEARRKKEQLLAKMREIDQQNQGAQEPVFTESSASESSKHASNPSIFKLTESEESAILRASAGNREGGGRRSRGEVVTTGMGRRALRSQISSDDLAFGGYAPSFGNSSSRGSSGFPPPPPLEDRDSTLEAIGVISLRGVDTEKEKETERGVKDRKSELMQQLFGALTTSAGDVSTSKKLEFLNSAPPTNGRSRREELLSFSTVSSTPPASSLNTLHVTDSRPAVRAITSFDDDIEELTL
ncbi:uncharacterized protein V6R79_003876 [Siganus canaliculatus]